MRRARCTLFTRMNSRLHGDMVIGNPEGYAMFMRSCNDMRVTESLWIRSVCTLRLLKVVHAFDRLIA
jgi:hypothetical protein